VDTGIAGTVGTEDGVEGGQIAKLIIAAGVYFGVEVDEGVVDAGPIGRKRAGATNSKAANCLRRFRC